MKIDNFDFEHDEELHKRTVELYGPLPERTDINSYTLKLDDDTIIISKGTEYVKEYENTMYFECYDDAKIVYDHFKDIITNNPEFDFHYMDEEKALEMVGLGPEKEITILVIEPGKAPEKTTIENTLEAKQKMVGGYIQAIYPYDDPVALIMNEEGKINGMELNRALYDSHGEPYDIVAGPMLVVGLSRDNFASLTSEQIEKFSKEFQHPERFLKINGRICIVPYEAEKSSKKESIKKEKPKAKAEER